jgi:hypothetical protein
MRSAEQEMGAFEVGFDRPLLGQLARRTFALPEDQLALALDRQRQQGGRLGDILVGAAALTRAQVAALLRLQARWTAKALRAHLTPASFPYPTFLSVCLPACNEEPNLRDTLLTACAILPEFVQDFEVVLVDDGSKDRSAALVAELARNEPRLRLVRHENNRGCGAALATGVRAAKGDLILITDADGQFSLLDLGPLLVALQGHDVASGYRPARADSVRRRLLGWCWDRLVGVVLGVSFKDLCCSFKVFGREVVARLRPTARSSALHGEVLWQCAELGLKVAQAPVQHYPRYRGGSGCGPRTILRALQDLLRLWRCRRHPVPPAPAVPPAAALCGTAGPGSGRSGTGARPFRDLALVEED